MPSQTFYIFTNPEPWRVPPMSPGRSKNGKLIVKAGADTMLKAYQEEVQDVLREQGAYMMEPSYRVNFIFHRTSESETSPRAGARRSRSDATNMQKAIEDALQGVVIENDKDDIDVRSRIIKPDSIITEPFVIVRVEGKVLDMEPSSELLQEPWFDRKIFSQEFEKARGAYSLDSVEEEWTP